MSTSGKSNGFSRLPAGTQFAVQVGTSTTSAFAGNGNLRVAPVYLPEPVTLTKLGVEVTAVGDAGCTLTPAVYTDDGTGIPHALIGQGAAVPGDVVGINLGVAAFTVPAGWSWWGALLLGAPVTQPTVRFCSSSAEPVPTGQLARFTTFPVSTWAVKGGLAAVPALLDVPPSTNSAVQIYGQT